VIGRIVPRFTRRALAVWWRDFLAWRHYYKSSVLLNFGEPVTNLLALGLGLGAYVASMDGVSFMTFIAPGLLAVTAMNAVTFDAAFEGYDRLNESGVYKGMITSPLLPGEIVAGELLWEATRSLLYGGIFLIVIAAFGLVHSLWALILPLPLLLVGMLFAAPALLVATLARNHENLFYYFTLVVTPMFMFSGVFFPIARLPAVVRDVVVALPLYHAVNLFRALILGRVHPVLWVDVAWLVGYTAVLCLLPTPGLRRRLTQ
jgi:lipooligosaccharide transport system permease protein